MKICQFTGKQKVFGLILRNFYRQLPANFATMTFARFQIKIFGLCAISARIPVWTLSRLVLIFSRFFFVLFRDWVFNPGGGDQAGSGGCRPIFKKYRGFWQNSSGRIPGRKVSYHPVTQTTNSVENSIPKNVFFLYFDSTIRSDSRGATCMYVSRVWGGFVFSPHMLWLPFYKAH